LLQFLPGILHKLFSKYAQIIAISIFFQLHPGRDYLHQVKVKEKEHISLVCLSFPEYLYTDFFLKSSKGVVILGRQKQDTKVIKPLNPKRKNKQRVDPLRFELRISNI